MIEIEHIRWSQSFSKEKKRKTPFSSMILTRKQRLTTNISFKNQFISLKKNIFFSLETKKKRSFLQKRFWSKSASFQWLFRCNIGFSLTRKRRISLVQMRTICHLKRVLFFLCEFMIGFSEVIYSLKRKCSWKRTWFFR